MAPSNTISRLQLLAAAALFSTGGAAIKYCELTSWQVAVGRSGLAALTILALMPEARRLWNWRVVTVALAHGGCMVLFVLANKLTTAAATIFLQSSYPLYVLALSPLLLKERVRRGDLRLMVLMGVGLAILMVGGDAPQHTAPDPYLGNILALVSGVFWALTLIGYRWLGKTGAAGGEDLAPATVVAGNLVACLVCLPWALPVAQVTLASGLVLGWLGVFQIALAYVALTAGLRKVPALEGALLLLLEPMLNPVWAWLLHAEAPGPGTLVGGAVILVATTWRVVQVGRQRR